MSKPNEHSVEFQAGFIMGYAYAQAQDIVNSRPRDLTDKERLELTQVFTDEIIRSFNADLLQKKGLRA